MDLIRQTLVRKISRLSFITLAMVFASTAALAPAAARGQSRSSAANDTHAPTASTTRRQAAGLPPAPDGTRTVIGGRILKVDPVLDTIEIQVPGGHSMKIFFDARTRAFLNGAKIPLKKLQAGEHASIETTLDGTDVFAVTIHMLSKAPAGQCQGQVLAYDPQTGILSVRSTFSSMPIKLRVPADTPIARKGQAASAPGSAGLSDLAPGALVEATFIPGHGNRHGNLGIAQTVTVLAQPGSAFEFDGRISYLNLASGKLTLVDPRNHKSYPISFNPSDLPAAGNLHEGEQVHISASFDGSAYTARKITPR